MSADDLLVVDETGAYLGAFRRRASACGMETLRSPFVQHVGSDPFDLESFAETAGRESELIDSPGLPLRPSLDLFLDHAARVVDRFDLRGHLREARVTGIERGRPLAVRTTGGTVDAEHVAIATGPGDGYVCPAWGREVPLVEHVWETERSPLETTDRNETVCVVGGGTTAGQISTSLADAGREVTLCTRRPIRTARMEADPRWLNWRHIERHLHSLPAGSRARLERVNEARNDGTMPPYLEKRVAESPAVSNRRCRVVSASPAGGGVELRCHDGARIDADRVVLATGFKPAYDRPLVDAVASSLGLQRGAAGVPVLDDETLSWGRTDGSRSRVFVTGALAACTVGPFAGNVAGARRAAERIAQTVRSETNRSRSVV